MTFNDDFNGFIRLLNIELINIRKNELVMVMKWFKADKSAAGKIDIDQGHHQIWHDCVAFLYCHGHCKNPVAAFIFWVS